MENYQLEPKIFACRQSKELAEDLKCLKQGISLVAVQAFLLCRLFFDPVEPAPSADRLPLLSDSIKVKSFPPVPQTLAAVHRTLPTR